MKEYFSHDYGATHDRKIAALVSKYKSSGYGIFWATCEMMHEEGGQLELDDITYSAISKNINEDEILLKNVIKDCIEKFKLFLFVDDKLTSNRVKKNLHKRLSISQVRAKAGKAGANAKQLLSKSKQLPIYKRKEKESKIKEIKEENKEEKIDFVFWENEKKQFLNSGDWIFKFCREKNIEVSEFDNQAKKFLSDMELKEEFEDLKELKRHFTNWYNKNKNGQHSTKNTLTKYEQESQDKLKKFKLIQE